MVFRPPDWGFRRVAFPKLARRRWLKRLPTAEGTHAHASCPRAPQPRSRRHAIARKVRLAVGGYRHQSRLAAGPRPVCARSDDGAVGPRRGGTGVFFARFFLRVGSLVSTAAHRLADRCGLGRLSLRLTALRRDPLCTPCHGTSAGTRLFCWAGEAEPRPTNRKGLCAAATIATIVKP